MSSEYTDELRSTWRDCACCDGTGCGSWYDDSYEDGSCVACDGTGEIEIDLEPITLGDLEEIASWTPLETP